MRRPRVFIPEEMVDAMCWLTYGSVVTGALLGGGVGGAIGAALLGLWPLCLWDSRPRRITRGPPL